MELRPILQLPVGTTPAEADQFLCVQDTAGTPTTRKMSFGRLLTLFSTLFKGSWSSIVTYAAGQIAESGGSAYQCIATSLNQAPPNVTYWKLIVAKGATGTAGSVWHYGSTAPDNSLGVDGDFYLRTTNDDVFVKGGGVWSIRANLKGSTGDVREWVVGSGAPTTEGEDGDWYLDGATGDIYGPRVDGDWPGSPAANIRGPTGPTGGSSPTGGATGTVWFKVSGDDYDGEWRAIVIGDVASLTAALAAKASTTHATAHAPAGSDALPWTTIHGRGTTGAKPAAAAGNAGYLYFDTTLAKLQRSTGSAWEEVDNTDAVTSVAGRTGAVTLALADVSGVQTALDAKQDTITGAATTIALSNLAVSRVLVSDGSGKVAASSVTATTLAYLDATSGIQAQIDSKQVVGNYITALTGDVTASGPGSVVATIANSAVTLAKMANMATASILGRNTSGSGAPEVLSAATAKTILSLSNVENTALSTWAGTASITTVGTLTTGVWNGTAVTNAYLANSAVTIGSTAVSLGATVATFAGVTLTSPTFTSPILGTPTSGTLTNCTIPGTALSGTTVGGASSTSLAATVLASSLTSLGTIASLVATTAAISGGTTTNSTFTATTAYNTNANTVGYKINSQWIAYCNVTTRNYALCNSAANSGTVQSVTGNDNIGIGYGTNNALTSGSQSVAIGFQTNYAFTGGEAVAIGAYANYNATTNSRVIAIGAFAIGSGVATGAQQLAIGYQAGYALTSCGYTVAIGGSSLKTETSGGGNGGGHVAVGYAALQNAVGADYNTAIGYAAGANISSGSYNMCFGAETLSGGASPITGSNNVGIGYQAGFALQGAGSENMLIGKGSGATVTTGSGNVCIGYQSGFASITTGHQNVFIGYRSGISLSAVSDKLLVATERGGTLLYGDFATKQLTVGGAAGAYPSLVATLGVMVQALNHVGLIVRGATFQSEDLTEWQNSDGTVLGVVTASGNMGIGTASPGAKLAVTGSGTGTGQAFVVVDSGSTERFKVLDNGNATFGGQTITLSDSGTITYGSGNTRVAGGVNGLELGSGNATFNTNNGYLFQNSSGFVSIYAPQNAYNTAVLSLVGKQGSVGAPAAGHKTTISYSGYNSANALSALGSEGFVIEDSSSSNYQGGYVVYTNNNGSNTEKLRVSATGNVGIGTTAPTNLLSLAGDAARTFWMERRTTAGTAYALTVQAGGAKSGETDTAGGDLYLLPGVSTGSAESGVRIQGCVAGATGTADRTMTTAFQVLGNKVAFFNATPVVKQADTTTALTMVTFSAPGTPDYAIQDLILTGYGFVTADEGQTCLSVIANLQTRVTELEGILAAYGLTP